MSDQNPVFIPGPTNIPDRLRNAMHVQTRDHRAPDFVETLTPVLNDLKRVFGTETGEIITFPSSGTGGWEAAITNTLSPGDKVLIARYGMFSHRWIDLCQRHGLLRGRHLREGGRGEGPVPGVPGGQDPLARLGDADRDDLVLGLVDRAQDAGSGDAADGVFAGAATEEHGHAGPRGAGQGIRGQGFRGRGVVRHCQ